MSRFYGSLCIKNKILTTLHNNSAGQIKLERRAVVINYTLRMVTGTVLSSITLQQRQNSITVLFLSSTESCLGTIHVGGPWMEWWITAPATAQPPWHCFRIHHAPLHFFCFSFCFRCTFKILISCGRPCRPPASVEHAKVGPWLSGL